MDLWNQLDLVPPALMNEECKTKHIKDEIRALTNTTGKMLIYFVSLHKFEKAAAYLSRFCVRYKARQRNMHGFQIMRRINQTLLRIKRLDIVREITDFHSFLPESSYIEKVMRLPVRSNLEHLLIRLQGLAKLMLRVVLLTKDAACYQLKQINRLFLFYHSSTFLALVGELWLLARNICRRVNQYYNELYPMLNILPDCTERWLPDHYTLSVSIAEWIGYQYQEEIIGGSNKKTSIESETSYSIFNLLQHHGSEETVSVSKITKEVRDVADECEPSEASLTSVPKGMLLEVLRSDTGERIESSKKVSRYVPKQSLDIKQLSHIKSKFQVKQFIVEERDSRMENIKQAVTAAVSESQFGDFNVRLMKEYNRLTSAEFVKFFKEQLILLIKE
uniref:Nucleolus and neural progenitor protein-like N-terminal domain-containing protein n=1 Tax=Anopheles triannulatus TaxID=58253 RepID=A0A2M4ATW3_9DIPT